jgi:trimeric autotransporter adhesin
LTKCANTATAQGARTNGWTHTGTICPFGDSDSWTFSANAGDAIIIRVGEITQTGSFTPGIRLQNPNALQMATHSGAVLAEIVVTATNIGMYTMIVDDKNGAATGTYRLTFAKSPGQSFVAPGDEGGPMTNGVAYGGNYLPPGDLDVWTFTANAADSFVVKAGQIEWHQ